MKEDSTGLVEAPCEFRRMVGAYDGRTDGPLVVVVAGLHGNEPAGVRAAERVLSALQRNRPAARGRLVAFAGNLVALDSGVRYVHKDMNRIWSPEAMAAANGTVEDEQQRQLLSALAETVAEGGRAVYLLDLHTSSAEGPPFLTIGDTLRNRSFALRFPLPVILGLEEQVDGALLEYVNNFGCVTLGVEGGHHDNPSSIDRHEAVLWLALINTGMLAAEDVPDLDKHRRVLVEAARSLPRIVEVRHRHPIADGDGFAMNPGFVNFQTIERQQHMATDKSGDILAPEGGLVLLPLYQGQGDDGFFVAREVRMFWLRVSGALRKLKAAALVRMLPGVRRHPTRPEVLVIDTRIARVYPLEVFHLFGFRKLRRSRDELQVSRRAFDLEPPERISIN